MDGEIVKMKKNKFMNVNLFVVPVLFKTVLYMNARKFVYKTFSTSRALYLLYSLPFIHSFIYTFIQSLIRTYLISLNQECTGTHFFIIKQSLSLFRKYLQVTVFFIHFTSLHISGTVSFSNFVTLLGSTLEYVYVGCWCVCMQILQ